MNPPGLRSCPAFSWCLREKGPSTLAKPSKYAGAFSPEDTNAPSHCWVLLVDGLVSPLDHDLLAHRDCPQCICLINTYPSFQISLLWSMKSISLLPLLAAQLETAYPRLPCRWCGRVTRFLCTEQGRPGRVQLTSIHLPEIAGPGPWHIPLPASWSSTTHTRVVPSGRASTIHALDSL